MKINRRTGRRFPAGFLAVACLIAWADPGFALRTAQPAGTATGVEELPKALAVLDDTDKEAMLLGKHLHVAGIRPPIGQILRELIGYTAEQGSNVSSGEIDHYWNRMVSEIESSKRVKLAGTLRGQNRPLWKLSGTLVRDRRTGQGLLIVGDPRNDGLVEHRKQRALLNHGVSALAILLTGDPTEEWRIPIDTEKNPPWRFLAENNLVGFMHEGRLYVGLNPSVQGSTQLNTKARDARGEEFGDTRMQPRSQFVRVGRIVKLETEGFAPAISESVWGGSSKTGIPLAFQGVLGSIPFSRFNVPEPEKFSSYQPIAQQVNDQAAGLEEPPLPLEEYFEIIPGKGANPKRVLFTFPPDPAIVWLYRAEGVELFVALPGVEPLGADPPLLRRLVQQVDPHHLEVFVNEKIDADLLDETVTPSLEGIHSMGLGFGNIDLAAAARRGIHPTYVGGDENPLRWATAEMAEALALAGRFDLLRRIGPATLETPKQQLLGEFLRNLAQRRGMKDQVVQQLLWAQLMRQMRKLDEAGRMVQEGRALGAGNGPLRTVEGHQLAADLKGSGIQTSLGLLPGSTPDLARWAALARAHGAHNLFYTGARHEILESQYGMVHIASVSGLLRESDYVLRAPDGPGLPQKLLDSAGAGRQYPWLVDPDRLALTAETSEVKKLLDSSLDGITVGVLGLGSIGSIAAADLKPMGVGLLSMIHDRGRMDRYDRLADELGGIEYVDLAQVVARSDVLILALPETDETKGILTPKILDAIDPTRDVVIVNVGRGSAVGATPEGERVFAEWLKVHPNVRYYTDVLRNEFLPVAEQPLLAPALTAQVFYSGHVASNTADPTGRRTRTTMGKTQFENFKADLHRKTPPNRVPMPAGVEEVNLAGVAFLVFDPAAAPALVRQLGPRGADLFVVAETPEIAQRLLEQGIGVDRLIGATGRGFLEDDYRNVDPLIQRFVHSYPDDWQAKLVDSLRLERLSQTLYPIYDPESLVKVLDGLAISSPLIRSILEERAGMEEGTGRET